MKKTVSDYKREHAYFIAFKNLREIGHHPTRVKQSDLGYFMTLENIRDYTSLDPAKWYEHECFLGEPVTLDLLSEEDRDMITKLLDGFGTINSQKDLEEKCRACLQFSFSFGHKMFGKTKKEIANT